VRVVGRGYVDAVRNLEVTLGTRYLISYRVPNYTDYGYLIS